MLSTQRVLLTLNAGAIRPATEPDPRVVESPKRFYRIRPYTTGMSDKTTGLTMAAVGLTLTVAVMAV